jgi:HK97 family phage major capsid protein
MSKFKDLNFLVSEANTLSSKATLSKAEERRYSFLLSAISCVKQGMPLTDIQKEQLNDAEKRDGLPITSFKKKRLTGLSKKQERKAVEFRDHLRNAVEQRDQSVGNPIPQVGSYAGLGAFSPVDFFNKIFRGLKKVDPLFDIATVINTTNGHAMMLPVMGDIENVSTPVGENSDQSANGHDIYKPSGVKIGAYSFRTPLWRLSREAFEDLDLSFTARVLFEFFASDRVARGFGKLAISGNGTTDKVTGILTILANSGAVPIIAQGSSTNTGGGESGANSLGSKDFANTYFAVDAAYRAGEKCGWLMNDTTLALISTVLDKSGRPLVDISYGLPTIMGKPVYVSPSMPNVGASNVPVLFGNFEYVAIRNAIDPLTRIQVFQQAPGLVEQGEYGLMLFTRHDVQILFNDWNGSPAPLVALQNHS